MLITCNTLLQLACALILLVAAICVKVSLLRDNSRSWRDIMKEFRAIDGRLGLLSYHPLLSEGLACAPHEAWVLIDGRRGLWASFQNAGVLLCAVDYLEGSHTLDTQILTTTRRLRAAAARVRFLLLIASGVGVICEPSRWIGKALEAYVSLLARTSYVVRDYRPDLYDEYRFYVLGGNS